MHAIMLATENETPAIVRASMETLIIEAIYENGVLKPIQPLPLQEREHVRITVESPSNLVRATAGLIACTDTQLIERIALDAIEDI